MNPITDIALFALLFFILVFVHELGHFLMAKWMGIRVEVFSIGMGPSILKFKRGDTEYRIAILPLGGFVKMSGDDPSKEYTEEEKKVGFLTQKPGAKLLVVFGGPVFNLIFPIFLFGLMLMTGVPYMESVVGTVEKGSPAEISGFQSADKITKLNGEPISKWSEIEKAIEASSGKLVTAQIARRNIETNQIEVKDIQVQPKLAPSKSKFGEDIEVGRIGVSPDFVLPQIFYTDDQSPLAKAGAHPFDRVIKIGAVEITTYDQMLQVLEIQKPGKIELTIEQLDLTNPPLMPTEDSTKKKTLFRSATSSESKKYLATLELPEGAGSVADRLGLKPITLTVGRTEKGSPAEKAGLLANDLLLSVGGLKLADWADVAKQVRGSEGKPVEVEWDRAGKIMKALITPEKNVIQDPLLGKDNPMAREAVYRIGVSPANLVQTSLQIEQSYNPIDWVKRGISETWNIASMTVQALTKLVTGKLSLKLLGSPIMIYKVAGNSYRLAGGGYMGWFSFLSNLAMLSITLGLVNLLPVPILDGGHAVFFMIEAIRGRPVSVKVMEYAMQVGLFLLICLFATVLFNDFNRYGWIDNILHIFR